ncbi:hypothetical protein FACS1894169_00810 [Bacteroidia bacterium]|nr:hypothetical protein FACS1894169_00810 [Bacteroidia bacterium]
MMKANELVKGKQYRYTAGCDPVVVTYLYETFNGYMFEANGVKNPLNIMTVKLYIEEL